MALYPRNLRPEIFSACAESKFPPGEPSRRFLPEGNLERIVTQQSVSQWLNCQDNDPLVDFVLRHAKRLFAISLMVQVQNMNNTMSLFRDHEISDRYLPLPTSETEFNSNLKQCFQGLKLDLMVQDEFVNIRQWTFLAPVFSVGAASAGILTTAKFAQGIIFPFTGMEKKAEGGFGIVYKVEVHKSHLHSSPDDPIMQSGSIAAIKELKTLFNMNDTESLAYKAWQKEEIALRAIGQAHHPHIIEVNAFMSRGEKHYFMFPWADGGNLAGFWLNNPSPVLTIDFIRDILTQLTGLASALEKLHELNCRHGDLKPENILIFRPWERQGLWKLADMGLAKFHAEATQQRVITTSSNYSGTISYEPPEAAKRQGPRSRRYDIWCMGCVTLQLIVWMLCGIEAHNKFVSDIRDEADSLKTSSFWTNSANPQLHPGVTRMMNNLGQRLHNKIRSPAMAALLHIVRSTLLVVQLDSRAQASAFHSALQEVQRNGQANDQYWLSHPMFTNQPQHTNLPYPHSPGQAGGQAGNINVSIAFQNIILSDTRLEHQTGASL